jgi:hypothetical protein
MRTLILIPYDETYMSDWFENYFIGDLIELGHSVKTIRVKNSDSINKISTLLNNEIQKVNFNYFFTVCNQKVLSIDLLNQIRLSAKTILFLPDNLLVPFDHKKIAKNFDLVWITSKETDYLFKRWKAKTIFLPYAAKPSSTQFELIIKTKIIRKVVFVGSPYGSRANAINNLISNNIPVDVYNPKLNTKKTTQIEIPKFSVVFNFLRFSIGRKVILARLLQYFSRMSSLDTNNKNLTIYNGLSLEDLAKTYQKYALCLSFVHARNTGILRKPVEIINLRNFEIPASGGIQFCQKTNEMQTYFEDNKEIVYYSSIENMVERARFILNCLSDIELIRIQRNAYIKSKNEHSWTNRFVKLFKTLGDLKDD